MMKFKELRTKEIMEFSLLGIIVLILVYSMATKDVTTIDKILLATLTLYKGLDVFKSSNEKDKIE